MMSSRYSETAFAKAVKKIRGKRELLAGQKSRIAELEKENTDLRRENSELQQKLNAAIEDIGRIEPESYR